MSTSHAQDRLGGLLTGPLAELGLDLEGVDLSRAGRRRVLRVAVDKDGGVTMDDVAEATRVVSRILDESDVLGAEPYTLEVSSPGVDRPLTLPRHWRRNADRLVRITLADGESLSGRVVESDEDVVVLDVAGARRVVPLAEIAKARVQVEFRRGDAGDRDDEEA